MRKKWMVFAAFFVFSWVAAANEVGGVYFVGNSITFHGKSEKIGWMSSWGMAASSSDSDYVGLIRKSINEYCTYEVRGVYNYAFFERDPEKNFPEDFNKIDFNNGVVVVFLGDNVDRGNEAIFHARLESQLKNIPGGRAIVVGTWWNNIMVDDFLEKLSSKMNARYISLNGISSFDENRAVHENKFVAAHPSDAGMNKIYEKIMPEIIKICKKD